MLNRIKIFNQLLCILYGSISIYRYALYQKFAKRFVMKDGYFFFIFYYYYIFIHIALIYKLFQVVTNGSAGNGLSVILRC